jgi:hypothetical protein
MVETSSRVPSRPPALGWHTHGESANQTLALDICECQRGIMPGIAVAQVAGDVSQHSRDNESSKVVRRVLFASQARKRPWPTELPV